MVETAVLLAASAAVSAASAGVGVATAVSSSNQAASAAGRQAQQAQADAMAERSAADDNSRIEIEQLEVERKAAATAARQEQAKVWKDAGQIVSAGIASRAGNGLDPYSMTGRALQDETLMNAAADLETISANAGRVEGRNRLAQQSSAQRAAVAGDRAARTAQQVALTSKNQAESARINAYGQIGQSVASGVRGVSQAGMQYANYMSRSETTPAYRGRY